MGELAWWFPARPRAAGHLPGQRLGTEAAMERGTGWESRLDACARAGDDRSSIPGRYLGESLSLQAARSYLPLPYRSFSDGSHRRVPLAELSRRGPKVFRGPSAADHRGGGGGAEEAGDEPGDGGGFRGIRRLVLVTEHSDLVDVAGPHHGATDLRDPRRTGRKPRNFLQSSRPLGQLPSVCGACKRNRIAPARPCLADSGGRAGRVDLLPSGANRFTNGDRRSLRWKTVSSQGSGFPDGQPYS